MSSQPEKQGSAVMSQKKSSRPIILLRRSSCGAITNKNRNAAISEQTDSKVSTKMKLPRLHSMPDINHSRSKSIGQYVSACTSREQGFPQYPSIKMEPPDEHGQGSSVWFQQGKIPLRPAGSLDFAQNTPFQQQSFQTTKNYFFNNGGQQIIGDRYIQSSGISSTMGIVNGHFNCQNNNAGMIPLEQKYSNGYGTFYCPTGVLDCENIRPRSLPNMEPRSHSIGLEQQCGYSSTGQTMTIAGDGQLKTNIVDDSLTNITWLGHMGVNNFLPMRVDKDGAHIRHLPLRSLKRGRPPYSYMALIQFAINSSPTRRMTLRQIYMWIEETFPYFKMAKPGWKNSIRHNLSLHDIFVREVSVSSKASYWTLRPDLNMRPLTLESIKGDAQHMFRPCHMLNGSSWQPEVTLSGQKPILPQFPNNSQPYLLFPLSGKGQSEAQCGNSMSTTRDCSSLFADSGCHSDMSLMTPSSTSRSRLMSDGFEHYYSETSSDKQTNLPNDVPSDSKENIKVRKRPRKQPLKTLNDSLNNSLHFVENRLGKSPESDKKIVKTEKQDVTDFKSMKENSLLFGSPNSFSEILNDLETPYKTLFSKGNIFDDEETSRTPPRKKCKRLQYQKYTDSPGFNEDLDSILRQHSPSIHKNDKLCSTPAKECNSTNQEYHQPTSTPICDEKYGRSAIRSLTPSRFLCSPSRQFSKSGKSPSRNRGKSSDSGFTSGTLNTPILINDSSVKHFVSPSGKKVTLSTYNSSSPSNRDKPSTSKGSPLQGFLPSVFGTDSMGLNNSFSKLLDLSGISLLAGSACSPSKFSDIADVSWSNLPDA